jgi:hypothetical protein
MITCKLLGGLGNQLFQIFTCIAYAAKYSQPFFFLNNKQLGNGENNSTIRYTYWDTFLSYLKPFLKNSNEIPELLIIKEKGYHYNELPDGFDNHLLLFGYFQSPKYFNNYKNNICRLLKIDIKKLLVKQRVNKDLSKTVSMHFRIGDYKKYPNVYPILSYKYYKNALETVLNEEGTNKYLEVLFFCESIDIDEVMTTIDLLKKEYPLLHFERANDTLSDWEQMLLMSMCRHNIIANSSFSWWGAYLNDSPCKIVCYPETWYKDKTKFDTLDLFPEDWNAVSSLS